MSTQYEYSIWTEPEMSEVDESPDPTEVLKIMGEKGWKLVSVITLLSPRIIGKDETIREFYFKREKTDKNETH